MYPRPGSNRHECYLTGFWDQRVYQFRHSGNSSCVGILTIWIWPNNFSVYHLPAGRQDSATQAFIAKKERPVGMPEAQN